MHTVFQNTANVFKLGGGAAHHYIEEIKEESDKNKFFCFEDSGRTYKLVARIGTFQDSPQEEALISSIGDAIDWNPILKKRCEYLAKVLGEGKTKSEEIRKHIAHLQSSGRYSSSDRSRDERCKDRYNASCETLKESINKNEGKLNDIEKSHTEELAEINGTKYWMNFTYMPNFQYRSDGTMSVIFRSKDMVEKSAGESLGEQGAYHKQCAKQSTQAFCDSLGYLCSKFKDENRVLLYSTLGGIGVYKPDSSTKKEYEKLVSEQLKDTKPKIPKNIEERSQQSSKYNNLAQAIGSNLRVAKSKMPFAACNIIGLREGGDPMGGFSEENNHYTKRTIENNADNAVFVFGGNAKHTEDRAASGKNQAAATGGNKNVFPIMTMGDISDEDLKYYNKQTQAILKEYVGLGGRAIFPLTKEGERVNVGTGIALQVVDKKQEEFINRQRKWADNLYNSLKRVKFIENNPEEAMKQYHCKMKRLEEDMKTRLTASKTPAPKVEGESAEVESKKENTIKFLQDEDIANVESFMKWNEDSYETLKRDPENKGNLKLFLNPEKEDGTKVFVGWGGRLSHERDNIFNINHVIDGGFADKIGLKKGDKIEIDLNHEDFKKNGKQFEGEMLEAALINKLRAGNLEGINKIGVYDLNNGANRRILEEYYKNDIRMFEDNKLRTDQEKVESKLDPVSQALVEKRRQDMTGEARADGRSAEEIEKIKQNAWMVDSDLYIFSNALGVRFSIPLSITDSEEKIYLSFGDDETLPEIKLKMTSPNAGVKADGGFHYEYIKQNGETQKIPGDGSCGFHAILAGLYDLDSDKKAQINNTKLDLNLSLDDVKIDNEKHMENVKLLRDFLHQEITTNPATSPSYPFSPTSAHGTGRGE